MHPDTLSVTVVHADGAFSQYEARPELLTHVRTMQAEGVPNQQIIDQRLMAEAGPPTRSVRIRAAFNGRILEETLRYE